MTRSIEVLTPLERKQWMERMQWEREKKDKKESFWEALGRLYVPKLTPSESDELDNCVQP